MNRREALAALMSLPPVARVQVASLKPNDVIVIECDGLLSLDSKKHIREQVECVWPGRRAVVLDGGLKLKVVSQ